MSRWSPVDSANQPGPMAYPVVARPRPRRERKPPRTWTHKLLGMLAMYGFFSLVLHAVVAWELTH